MRVFVASCPDLTDARIFALTHPRTGAAVQFVRAGDALLEVHRFRDGAIPRSWLLGGEMEMVLEDGSLLCAAATPRHATHRLSDSATHAHRCRAAALPRCRTDQAPLAVQARHPVRPALPPPLTFGPQPFHAPRRRSVRSARCGSGAACGEPTRDTAAPRLRVRRQGHRRRVLRALERREAARVATAQDRRPGAALAGEQACGCSACRRRRRRRLARPGESVVK